MTSTARRELRVLLRTVRPARCPPRTQVLFTSSSAFQIAGPWISVSSNRSHPQFRIPAGMRTQRRTTRFARTRFVSSMSSTISPAKAIIFARRLRDLNSQVLQRELSTHSRSRTWLRSRSVDTRCTAFTSCPAWDSATTMPPLLRSTMSLKVSTMLSMAHTMTAAAVLITGTRPRMAVL